MLRSDANRAATTAAHDAYVRLHAAIDSLAKARALLPGHDADAADRALAHVHRALTHVESMRVLETTNTDWGI